MQPDLALMQGSQNTAPVLKMGDAAQSFLSSTFTLINILITLPPSLSSFDQNFPFHIIQATNI